MRLWRQSTTAVDDPAPDAAGTVAAAPPDEGSRLRSLVGILKKHVGASDLAAVRFSLPTWLIHPIPNLEHWTYLDRPETFVSIGNSPEPLGRMLETLRFWFTKDLKYVKEKPIKPYNSTLGEFFRCSWEIPDLSPINPHAPRPASSAAAEERKPVKLSFLTEQTSHHPPVSAFYISCPEKGIHARGYDQISAQFQLMSASLKVTPGQHNLGIFITLSNWDDEQYQLTHPPAKLSGFITGSLNVSVVESSYIRCDKTGLVALLEYPADGYSLFGSSAPPNQVKGVVFRSGGYDLDRLDKMKCSDVRKEDIVATIDGSLSGQTFFTLADAPDSRRLLIDVGPLSVTPKTVPPEPAQQPNESRRFWSGVTEAILAKDYARADALKVAIEENQRAQARDRDARGQAWKPAFFVEALEPVGLPSLTPDGERVLQNLVEGKYEIEGRPPVAEAGAEPTATTTAPAPANAEQAPKPTPAAE